MSDEQCALQEEVVGRYEWVRPQQVDPREGNALASTTDGRKLALGGRVLAGWPRWKGRRQRQITAQSGVGAQRLTPESRRFIPAAFLVGLTDRPRAGDLL